MFSYGFYNNLPGEENPKVYDAKDISKMFDGVITDGVFATIGSGFAVTPSDPAGLSVIVGSGKAWLDHTWNILDTPTSLSFDQTAGLSRIDAIVIDVDVQNRLNELKIVKGTESSNPTPPTLLQENYDSGEHRHWQYPIAYVTILSTSVISSTEINYKVGQDPLPIITGIPEEAITTTQLISDWQGQFTDMMNRNGATFNGWFENLQDQLDDNQAAHLQNEIDNLITSGTTPLDDNSELIAGRVYFQYEV